RTCTSLMAVSARPRAPRTPHSRSWRWLPASPIISPRRAIVPPDRTEPRTVVVTGASAGIGRATAVAFGRCGDRVALLARGEAGLAAARDEVTKAGGCALALPVDVADFDAVDA